MYSVLSLDFRASDNVGLISLLDNEPQVAKTLIQYTQEMYKQILELNSCKITIIKRKTSNYFLEERFSHTSLEIELIASLQILLQKSVGNNLQHCRSREYRHYKVFLISTYVPYQVQCWTWVMIISLRKVTELLILLKPIMYCKIFTFQCNSLLLETKHIPTSLAE